MDAKVMYTLYAASNVPAVQTIQALGETILGVSQNSALLFYLGSNPAFPGHFLRDDVYNTISFDASVTQLLKTQSVYLYTIETEDVETLREGMYRATTGRVASCSIYPSLREALLANGFKRIGLLERFEPKSPVNHATPEDLLARLKGLKVGYFSPRLGIVIQQPTPEEYEAYTTISPDDVERYSCGMDFDRALYAYLQIKKIPECMDVRLVHVKVKLPSGFGYHNVVIFAKKKPEAATPTFYCLEPTFNPELIETPSLQEAISTVVATILKVTKLQTAEMTFFDVKNTPPYGCTLPQYAEHIRMNNQILTQ